MNEIKFIDAPQGVNYLSEIKNFEIPVKFARNLQNIGCVLVIFENSFYDCARLSRYLRYLCKEHKQ